ncbi:hypothetical protein [Abyssisolibacter fermentans]|nr:hypothetical protein [Abyssisolibacter fermentans]
MIKRLISLVIILTLAFGIFTQNSFAIENSNYKNFISKEGSECNWKTRS